MRLPNVMDSNLISVVIPARDEGSRIAEVIDAVARQLDVDADIEIVVVDDGSSDDTVRRARAAGALVIETSQRPTGGNPARARNIGAKASRGDPIVFLDADCVPDRRWLASMLRAHGTGAVVVGGALGLPSGLSAVARCDYYSGCYFIHERRAAGRVPHHPPNNISVRRDAFLGTKGFSEHAPLSYTNEERHWQAELRQAGGEIFFEPAARVLHFNRPGFGNLLRRSYRWGYTAIEAKAETGSTRAAWLHARPWLVIALAPGLPFVLTAHVCVSWARAGFYEPILMTPIIFASRVAYVLGMLVGGLRWLMADPSAAAPGRPSPRWQ